MNNNTKRILIFIPLLSLVTWLIFSNIIASFITTGKILQRTSLENIKSTSTVYYAIDKTEYNPLHASLLIEGWSFCSTEYNNENRKISFIFYSNKNTYNCITTFNIQRSGVIDHFKSTDLVINNDMLGFSQNIPIASMKDGIYQLRIYVEENQENYGITPTNYWFEKAGTSFNQVEAPKPVIEASESKTLKNLPVLADLTLNNIDAVEIIESNIHFRGWTYINNKDASNQEVSIVITEDNKKHTEWSTLKRSRPDVAAHFDNNLYTMSGFEAIIPIEEFDPEKNYTFTVYVENEEITMQSNKYNTINEILESLQKIDDKIPNDIIAEPFFLEKSPENFERTTNTIDEVSIVDNKLI